MPGLSLGGGNSRASPTVPPAPQMQLRRQTPSGPHLLCNPGQLNPTLELPPLVSRGGILGEQACEAPTPQQDLNEG